MHTENIFPYIFWERLSLTFCSRKNIMFSGKNTIFPDNTRKIMSRRGPFCKDLLFRKFEENVIFPCIFFWEISSFIVRLRCQIIFLGKRNMVFPDNTRKIIFQRNFFGKIIFSGRLEKENMVFRAVFAMIYIIHKMLVLLKNYLNCFKDSSFECFLKSIVDFCFSLKIFFFITYNNGKFKSWIRKHN